MKGYKALDMDMRAPYNNYMQYAVEEWYSVEWVCLRQSGFHFCKTIENLNCYYSIKNSRIFEVEADGKIIEDTYIYVSEKIKLVRELTKEEINDYFKQNCKKFVESEDDWIREATAAQGYGLDKLVYDEDLYVRQAVAEQGYGLDVLVYDKVPIVKHTVAKQGYGLDILLNDTSEYVRQAVAAQGYGLDKLVYDESWEVRSEVAEQGYGLDILINDKEWIVRTKVAEQGYGLDKLIYDEDEHVRGTAWHIYRKMKAS